MNLEQPFKLPCGAVLPNRIAKAAMTERLANKNQFANEKHETLYKHWASTGSGLLISGNIIVDKRYKEASGNIVIENEDGLDALKAMAKAGTSNNNHFWAQISHAGRQSSIFSTFKSIAPSPVKLKKLGLFTTPHEMTKIEIEDVIERYVNTARIAQKAGFTGVQFHAAHGYLLTQFLLPKTNKRTDEFGGSIENRAKVLFLIIEKARKVLGKNYPISVKLNSADFQRGGYNDDDAFFIIKRLEELGVDLLEISGGTYEHIDFLMEAYQRKSTQQREAYFWDFAQKVRQQFNIPLMVTGGFRSYDFCEKVLADNLLDVIGFARPYLIDKQFPKSFLQSKTKITNQDLGINIKIFADMAEGGWYDYQIHQLANNQPLKLNYNPWIGLVRLTKNEMVKGWF